MKRKTATWLIPLCYFAYDWHNGNGRSTKRDRVSYGLACRVMRACKRRGMEFPLDVKLTPAMKKVYRHLEETYIPAEWRKLNENAGDKPRWA